ncbi:hypothetical protein [Clostridium sp. JNZ J1-5]
MDNVTLIGVVGSVVSILSFFLAIFLPSSKTNTNSNNRTSIDRSFNSNSFNTVTNNVNVTYKVEVEGKDNSNQRTHNDVDYNSDNFWGILIIGIFAVSIITKFYITYQDAIIFWIIVFGIGALCVNCLLLIILNRKTYVPKKYLYFNTSKWIPLFITLIFIYKPFYKSLTFTKTKLMLRNINNFIDMFQNYRADVTFIIFQILGLIFVSIFMILYVYMIIVDLKKSIKDSSYNVKPITVNEIVGTCILMIIVFFLVSGLIINVFYKC